MMDVNPAPKFADLLPTIVPTYPGANLNSPFDERVSLLPKKAYMVR